jgi:hypothetical protein
MSDESDEIKYEFDLPDEPLSMHFIYYHRGHDGPDYGEKYGDMPEQLKKYHLKQDHVPRKYQAESKPYPAPFVADRTFFISRSEFCTRVYLNRNSFDIYRQEGVIPKSSFRIFKFGHGKQRRYYEDFARFVEAKKEEKYDAFESQRAFYEWIKRQWNQYADDIIQRIPKIEL